MGIALLVIGLVVGIVGSLMVVAVAFRQSLLWGLGSLFLAPVWLIFIVLHWEESKRGFFISLAGTAILFLGVFFLPTADLLGGLDSGSEEVWDEPLGDFGPATEGEAPAETTAAPDLPLSGSEALDSGEGVASAAGREPRRPLSRPSLPRGPAAPRPRPRENLTVPVERASSYIGQLVDIVKVDGTVVTARIRHVDEEGLRIEQPVGGGSITFSLPRRQIQELRVRPR